MARWRRNLSETRGPLVFLLCAAPLVVAAAAVLFGRSWLELAAVVAGYAAGVIVWRRSALAARSAAYVAPSNLPPPPTRMVGREDELSELRDLLLDNRRLRRIANVCGVAGIGKTAFSLCVAHQVAGAFPGGELFVRFDPDTDEHAARRLFIQALRPPGARMPKRIDEQIALYRGLMRRVNQQNQLLMVFDDAPDAKTVKALLPDTPWCAAVITSRQPIEGLDARPLVLGRLNDDAAMRMLQAIIGYERVRQEPGVARDLVSRAAHHPLAIQLMGMALANRPNTKLGVARQWMMALGEAGPGTFDSALDLSYAMLTRGEQRALTTLGLLGKRRFRAWELGALLGLSENDAWLFCDRLTEAGLLARRSPDAAGVQDYVLLEHVEGYARRRVTTELSVVESLAATDRLVVERDRRSRRQIPVDLFERVQVTVEQGRISRAFKDARDAVTLARELEDHSAEAEATAMLAELHAELGGAEDVLDLLVLPLSPASPPLPRIRAWRISAKLHRRLRQVDLARDALAEATAINARRRDPNEQVRLLRESAIAESVGPTPDAGLRFIHDAHRILSELGGIGTAHRLRAGIAYAEGRVYLAMGKADEALPALQAGVDVARECSQLLWETWIGYEAACAAFHLHRHSDALVGALNALKDFSGMRHRYGSAHCRQLIGQVLAAQDDLDRAVRFSSEALETFHNCGDAWTEAEAAEQLAEVHRRRGDASAWMDLLETARRLYASIGMDGRVARNSERLTRLAVPR